MKISTTPSVIVRLVIWLFLLVGGAWISIDFDQYYFQSLWDNLFFHLVTLSIGLLLTVFSFRAAAAGGRELAHKGREGNLPRLETNRLVTTGVYACTRHPMLFGLMLLPMALAMLLGSPTFILIIAPVEVLLIFVMILTIEEREAIAKFGTAYREYRQQTPLFPKSQECWMMLFGRRRGEK